MHCTEKKITSTPHPRRFLRTYTLLSPDTGRLFVLCEILKPARSFPSHCWFRHRCPSTLVLSSPCHATPRRTIQRSITFPSAGVLPTCGSTLKTSTRLTGCRLRRFAAVTQLIKGKQNFHRQNSWRLTRAKQTLPEIAGSQAGPRAYHHRAGGEADREKPERRNPLPRHFPSPFCPILRVPRPGHRPP